MTAQNTWLRKPRKPIGEAKRELDLAEKRESAAFEGLLRLHKLDWWHCTVAQASQPGWPDYVVLGTGWMAFVELKARRKDGSKGGVSPAQRRYEASIRQAGGEWVTFLWPDEQDETNLWLREKTGIVVVFQ